MADKQFRADLVDVIVQTLTRGLMVHINKVLKEYDYSGEDLLNTEYDDQGNAINIQNWDFRPMSSNRPRPEAPYLLVGRILPWSDDNTGMLTPRQATSYDLAKQEDKMIVASQTTGAVGDGDMLIDGLTNFRQYELGINQYVARLDSDGNEEAYALIRKVMSPHKIKLQDPLFYETYGGEPYEIYHTMVDRAYKDSGITLLRFAVHNYSSEKATICAHAIRHYFETLRGNSDLIDVELEEREAGENPAWAFVEEVGDITDASRLLSEDETQKGVQHRHEVQISLKVAEVLHRRDEALESNLQVSITQPE